ncbi:polysaccharide deacetylase family protein [Christiangramia fulva]|uniref:Polysaccharide deacetylase family protein n=2 Tax=Christiangramia fulva TaxID=2126553 RepID=A0A2R3ZB31_9FLAO|nr:polysaccharide deacetylase family protein [Christiangramia fulva]
MLVLSTNVRFNFFVKSYNSRKDFTEKKVALSFDDGPTTISLELLDILDKFNVKAAFFCIGKEIEKNPDIFREIIKRGHIVGNHTYSHTKKMGFISSEKIYEEIIHCDKVAKKIGGVQMKLFRPPFGIINPKTKKALQRSGHTVIGWSIRPYDAITKSNDVILKRITRKVKSGDLILLHDNMPKTPAILEQLLVLLKQQNFGTIRPDKLFEIDAYN